jgi:hypothetical protein
MTDDELQTRTCRVCGRTYKYPVPKSLATRFQCDVCVQLDEDVRAMFEYFHKKIKALQREVDGLKKTAKPAAPTKDATS